MTAGNEARPHGEGGAEQPASAPELWRRGFELLGSFGPPITVGTALLVYFGWARTDAEARSMGIDASLFGYSVQDLVLRSIPSLYLPLVWLLLLAVLWLALDRAARRLIAWGNPYGGVRRTAKLVLPVGLVLAAALWTFVIIQPGLSVLYVPYALAGAILLAAWGLSLRREIRAADVRRAETSRPAAPEAQPSGWRSERREGRTVERILLFTLVSLLLFWGTSDYAQAVGRGLAIAIEQRADTMPGATVYSAKRLGLEAPGVTEQVLGTAEAPLFRYVGLRLLVVSGGRIFLLHDGWTLARGRVIVLPDDSSVRVEYGTAPAAPG